MSLTITKVINCDSCLREITDLDTVGSTINDWAIVVHFYSKKNDTVIANSSEDCKSHICIDCQLEYLELLPEVYRDAVARTLLLEK